MDLVVAASAIPAHPPARAVGAITWARFSDFERAGGLAAWVVAKRRVRRPWLLVGVWPDLEVWAPVTTARPPGPCATQAGGAQVGPSGQDRGYRGGWVSCRALGVAEEGALPLVGDLRLPRVPAALEVAAAALAEAVRRVGPVDALAPLTAACRAASPSLRRDRRL